MADDLAELRALNSAYVRAVQHSDAAWFERHLAEDFVNTNPDCTLSERPAFLEEDVRIRIVGDVALIHARTTYAGPDGRPGGGRYTDIWQRRNGRWLCIAAHVSSG